MSSSDIRRGKGRQAHRVRRDDGHSNGESIRNRDASIRQLLTSNGGGSDGDGQLAIAKRTEVQSAGHRSGSTNGQVMTQRWELKYVVDRSVRTALDRDLCALMDPDVFSARHGSYIVRSLYFDTLDYMAYHSKLAGDAVRHKLRTRIYTDKPDEAKMVRLEIKSRLIGTVHKIAADVTVEQYSQMWEAIQRRLLPAQELLDVDRGVREFFRLLKQFNMQPAILVQYRRRAFERNDLSRVRVNFDNEIVGSRDTDLMADIPNPRGLLRYGHSVFEVKVDGVMPYWLHMLIDKYNLRNQSFSKFCNAIYSESRRSSILRDD